MTHEFLKAGTRVMLPAEPARFSASSGRMYEKARPRRLGRVICRLTSKAYEGAEWYAITDLVTGTTTHRKRESFEVLADAS